MPSGTFGGLQYRLRHRLGAFRNPLPHDRLPDFPVEFPSKDYRYPDCVGRLGISYIRVAAARRPSIRSLYSGSCARRRRVANPLAYSRGCECWTMDATGECRGPIT